MSARTIGCAALILLALPACSSREMYNAGAGARQHECSQMLDRDERERCLRGANRSYEEYERARKP